MRLESGVEIWVGKQISFGIRSDFDGWEYGPVFWVGKAVRCCQILDARTPKFRVKLRAVFRPYVGIDAETNSSPAVCRGGRWIHICFKTSRLLGSRLP